MKFNKVLAIVSAIFILYKTSPIHSFAEVINPGCTYINPEDASMVWSCSDTIQLIRSDGSKDLYFGLWGRLCVLESVPETSEEILDLLKNLYAGAIIEDSAEPYIIRFTYSDLKNNYIYEKTDVNPIPLYTINKIDNIVTDYKTGEVISEMDNEFVIAIEAIKGCYIPVKCDLRVPEIYLPDKQENTKTPKVSEYGDINSDGKSDLSDLSEISLAILGDKSFTSEQKIAADVDGDGEMTLADLAKFKQYITKQIESLG